MTNTPQNNNKTKVIIAVLGKSIVEGASSSYRLDNNTYECSCAASFIPILDKTPGKKALLLIAPHSLFPSEGNTNDFKNRLESELVGCDCGEDYKFENINGSLKVIVRGETYDVYIQPVQVRGEIGYYKFNGDPRTAFTATYYALTQIEDNGKIDEIIIDTTHGWNHILLLTALGAQAYAKINNTKLRKLRYYTTEPTAGSGGGTASSSTLNIFEIKGIHTILKLIDTISNFQSFSIRGFTLEDQEELIKLLKEDIKEKDADKAKQLPEIIVEFRRLLCGLSTAMIPYIHMKLLSLKDKKDTINNYLKQLGEKIGEIVDSEGDTEITYTVNSSLLSYVVLHMINHVLDDLIHEIGGENISNPGQITKSFIKCLHNYYNDKWPLMASIMEHELNIIFDHNIHCSNNNNPKGVASRVLCGENGFFDNPTKYKSLVKKIKTMLSSPSGQGPLTDNDIKMILRNLYAHLGIQNYTIRCSCIESCDNVEYVVELFERLEQLPNRPSSSICDLFYLKNR